MFKQHGFLGAAHFFGLLMAFVLAAPVTMLWDDELPGTPETYIVDSSDQAVDFGGFLIDLTRFSKETGTGIAIRHQGIDIPLHETRLYIVSGSNLDVWIDNPPRPFDPGQIRSAEPASKLDPQFSGHGIYYLFPGGRDGATAVHDFEKVLAKYGLSGVILQHNLGYFLSSSVTPVVLISILFALSLGVLHVVLRNKEHAIKRMYGKSSFLILKEDYLDSLPFLGKVLIATIPSVALILFFYNRWAALSTYLSFSVIIYFILILATSVGYFLTLFVFEYYPVINTLKGKLPASSLVISIYAVRIGTVIIVLSLVGVVVSASTVHNRLTTEAQEWQQHSDLMSVYISGSAGEQGKLLAPQLRAADQAGDVLFSNPRWNMPLHNSPDDRPLLLMNRAGLDSGPLGAYLPEKTKGVTVLYPDTASTSEIRRAIAGVKNEYEIATEEENTGTQPELHIQQIRYSSGLEVFNYVTGFGGYTIPAFSKDPVVVVLAAGLYPLSDYNIYSALTQSTLMLRNKDVVTRIAASEIGNEVIAGFQPTAARTIETRESLAQTYRVSFIGLILGIMLTIISVFASGVIYQLRHRQQLWVRYLIGQHPIRGRVPLLLFDAGIIAIVVIWLAYRQWSFRREIAMGTSRALELSETASLTTNIIIAAVGIVVIWEFATIVTIQLFNRFLNKGLSTR